MSLINHNHLELFTTLVLNCFKDPSDEQINFVLDNSCPGCPKFAFGQEF